MTDIREQITILVALQGVEMEIVKAGQRIDALNDEAHSLEQSVAEQAEQVAAEKNTIDGLKKTYREFEAESKDNLVKIEKSNGKLRAVKTNKEYQSTLKEIEEIQKKNSGLEDRMLEILDQLELQEGAVRQKEAQFARHVQACNEKKQTIVDQIHQIEQAIKQLSEKKAQVLSGADPKVMAVLAEVKKKVRGMAVAPAEQAICMGCHMNIPAQLYNELRRYDELRFCPHCHRIIYWKEKEDD